MGDRVATSPCPICKKPVRPRVENPAHPFCSARCKQVELGKWLNEEYRVPAEEDGESAQSADRSAPEADDPEGVN